MYIENYQVHFTTSKVGLKFIKMVQLINDWNMSFSMHIFRNIKIRLQYHLLKFYKLGCLNIVIPQSIQYIH